MWPSVRVLLFWFKLNYVYSDTLNFTLGLLVRGKFFGTISEKSGSFPNYWGPFPILPFYNSQWNIFKSFNDDCLLHSICFREVLIAANFRSVNLFWSLQLHKVYINSIWTEKCESQIEINQFTRLRQLQPIMLFSYYFFCRNMSIIIIVE